jgi:putative SOS response-associated peptidase YedK
MNISDHEGIRSLLESLGMETWPVQKPRYNIAPTQALDVVTLDGDQPTLANMSWGISMKTKGAKGQPITRRIPNSRDDKVWTSYLWRYLIPEQRVLIPVNGFYEWKRKNKKLIAAYHITPAGKPAMFFAGIYRKPKDEQADPLCEVSIVTTSANEAMSDVHDRMPVILSSQNAAMAWLLENDRETLDELMQPASNDALLFTQVSDYVNKSTNEGPECIEALAS